MRGREVDNEGADHLLEGVAAAAPLGAERRPPDGGGAGFFLGVGGRMYIWFFKRSCESPTPPRRAPSPPRAHRCTATAGTGGGGGV
jgi:hypothetical protein